jgi:O-antigen/teichoic acid export membrane protein
VKHGVRRTLTWLAAGAIAHRVLQLVTFVLVGRALGVGGLGTYAGGQALAATLAVLAGLGVRNLAAREIAQKPQHARAIVAAAVQLRLVLATALVALATAVAWICAEQPWFWTLSVALALPAAFDLKNLGDAAGQARSEVRFEGAAATLQFVLVAAWAAGGGERLATLAAIALLSRSSYAALAWASVQRLPGRGVTVRLPWRKVGLGAAQTLHELLAAGDVALVGWFAGADAAGLYAVATRFAGAALVPSSQIARLLMPHVLHAGARGDGERTLATALRATAWTTLPLCAGGIVVAERLCALGGEAFVPAAAALQLLLVGGACQHLGWQWSHALLARGRDTAYAFGLGLPATLHAALFVLVLPDDRVAATAAATIAAGAHLLYLLLGRLAHGGHTGLSTGAMPWLAAAATAGAAALVGAVLPEALALPAQLLAGGAAYGAVLFRCELRGRGGRIGDGLAAASGFVH